MASPDISSSSFPVPAALGPLADESPDVMTLHTRDALRMYTGRAGDAKTQVPAIPGGRRFAAVLKSIWFLSANDNPYADWILIRVYQSLAVIRVQMAQAVALHEAEIEALRRKGLSICVLGSRNPATVSLVLRSPYGYAAAEAIVEFDYHVRLVKTLVLKDRLSDDAGRAAIRQIGRSLRALFLAPISWERLLLREEMLALSRRDFLPGADDAARSRIRAAVAMLGDLPGAVFTGDELPRHSQRRIKPSPAELRLLQQASTQLDAVTEPEVRAAEQLL